MGPRTGLQVVGRETILQLPELKQPSRYTELPRLSVLDGKLAKDLEESGHDLIEVISGNFP